MKIDAFRFGTIEIDGVKYGKDVLIQDDGSINKRKGGFMKFGSHNITKDEIADLAGAGAKPDLIIVGLGTSSAAELDPEAKGWAEKENIELVAVPSKDAVDRFNREMEGNKKVAALIHITC